MNSLTLILSIGTCFLIFCIPRKYVLGALISGMILVPPYNAFTLGPINLPILRILLLCLLVRAAARGELKIQNRSALDGILVAWAVWMTLSYVILNLTLSSIVNRIGGVWIDIVLTYFLCRVYLTDLNSILTISKFQVFIVMFLGCLAFIEFYMGVNLFSFIGGKGFVQLRGGTTRCQGPFAHPIALGAFAAMALPVVWALYKDEVISRMLAVCSMGVAISTVFFSGSSSSVFTLAGTLLAIALWKLRSSMMYIRRGLFVLVVLLEVAMTAHVWWLMARINPFGGSAYHRAKLIDYFIANIGEWWLFGTMSNAEWGGGGYMTDDVANHLLRMGTMGGVLSIVIFLIMIGWSFKHIGKSLRAMGSSSAGRYLLWGFGCVLFAHLVTFIGLSYWDQMRSVLYVHFAMAASLICVANSPNVQKKIFCRENIITPEPVPAPL